MRVRGARRAIMGTRGSGRIFAWIGYVVPGWVV